METQLLTLEATLRDEAALYSTLVNRLPFKLALIRKNRVEQLGRLTRQEEEEIRQLQVLERTRAACMSELAVLLGPGVEERLNTLLPRLSAEWRLRLSPLGEKLRQLTRTLKEGHETARVLLGASLDYTDLTMSLIGRAVAQSQTTIYGAPPIIQAPSLLLDRRA